MTNDNSAKPKKDYRFYSILWARFGAIFEVERRNKVAKYLVGVCGFRSQVFRVEHPKDILHPLIMNNLYITFDEQGAPVKCEEAEGCLCFECPLNRTTWESYKRRTGARGHKPKAFGQTLDCNRKPDGTPQYLKEWTDKYKQGGVLLFEDEQ